MMRRYLSLVALLLAPFVRGGVADGVQVTPNSGTIDVPPYAQAQTQVFSVTNTGTRTVDFSIQAADCQPIEMNCAWSTFSLNGVGPNQSVPLTVTFTSGAPGWSGTISFVAKVNDNQSVAAAASVTVHVPQQAWVETKSINPGATVERSHCVGFAVATNAASECGDLRVVHELPSLRIRSDDRTPVLLYNSAHADPFPVVRANVSTPSGTAATNVTASLLVQRGNNRVAVASQSIASLPAASTRRVALGYSASGDTTGIYAYTFKVTMTVNGVTRTDSSFDTLVVVNRANSAFGAGWWVAGFEQWKPVPNGFLWVGGDGSTRLFRPVDVNGNVLAAMSFDRPDTAVNDSVGSTGYYRRLRHGARTVFLNRHVATIDPLGFRTTFEYDANGRLISILHPGAGQLKHRFFYSGPNGTLDSVTAPGPTGGSRKVVVSHAQRGKITRVTDPDGKFVTFDYGPPTSVTMQGRTNRNGFTQTFGLTSNRVVQASVPLTASATATSVFCPAEIRGLGTGGCGGAGPLTPDAAVTTIDGPRPGSDVNDLTTIAIDRYGGPSVVTDAFGNSTRLYRGNRGLPDLVTRTVAKNGWVNEAFYNANGLIAALVEYAPLGPGRDAVTLFQWDTKWERVTQISYPEQNIVRFAYDTLTGNRIWQEDGRGAASRVNFRYYTSGGGDRLLRAAEYPTQSPIGDRDSVEYDANGNVTHVRQVSGNLVWAARHFVNDAAGRTTSACTDIDIAGNGGQQCQLRVYDVMDRDSVVTDSGPPMLVNNVPNTPAQAIRVRSFYDPEGNLTKVERSSFNNGVANGIGTLTTQWFYDRANRRVKEIAGDGASDSLVYDAAGNTTQFLSRRTDPANPATRLVIGMTYDALNRLTRRVVPAVTYPSRSDLGIPVQQYNDDTLSKAAYPRLLKNAAGGLTIAADTETFAYDAMGAITGANNHDALVSRTYYANGLTKAETLKVRDYTGSDFSKHVYATGYEYDLDRRRSALTYPAQLATTAGGTFNRVRYQYDGGSGALASVTDLQKQCLYLCLRRPDPRRLDRAAGTHRPAARVRRGQPAEQRLRAEPRLHHARALHQDAAA